MTIVRYKMNCYILHTFLLVTILLLFAIIMQTQVKPKKKYWHTNKIRIENNEFKRVFIKNRTCYYFNDIIKFEDFGFDNILLAENSCKSILINNVSYKTLIGAKPLRVISDKVDGFVRDYDRTKYLVLFIPKNNNAIFDRIRYFIPSCVTYVDTSDYVKIKIDSDDALRLEKHFFSLTMHNLVILIKSVFNKQLNQYYCKTFSRKCSYQLAKNNENKILFMVQRTQ